MIFQPLTRHTLVRLTPAYSETFFVFSNSFTEIQAPHQTAQPKPTGSRRPDTSAGSPRWHLGSTRVRHGSTQWAHCTIQPSLPRANTLLRYTDASRLLHYGTAAAAVSSPPVAPPHASPPAPRLQDQHCLPDAKLAGVGSERERRPFREH